MRRTPPASRQAPRTSRRPSSVRPPMRSEPHVPPRRMERARAQGDSSAGGSATCSRGDPRARTRRPAVAERHLLVDVPSSRPPRGRTLPTRSDAAFRPAPSRLAAVTPGHRTPAVEGGGAKRLLIAAGRHGSRPRGHGVGGDRGGAAFRRHPRPRAHRRFYGDASRHLRLRRRQPGHTGQPAPGGLCTGRVATVPVEARGWRR